MAWVLTFVVAACVTQQPETSTSADPAAITPDNSSSLVVYTALEDDQIKEYLSSFKTQHPDITVNTVRDSTGIVTAKLMAEKDNPQADVVWGLAATSLLVADQEGMLEPYAPKGLEQVQAQLRDPRNPPTWVGIDAWMSAFCVNTVEANKKNLAIPTSWADLTKPEYKGQIVMSDPAASGTGFLSVSALLQMKGEEKGWQYLDALDQNVAEYVPSGSKPCKLAGTGEHTIGVSFDYRAAKAKASGEPIQAVFPTEGSGWDIESNALIKKAQIKPAAKTFLDWAISTDASKKYAENFAVTAVKTDVPIPEGYPADPLAQMTPKNDFNWAAKNRDRILTEWTKRYGSKTNKG
ncbi:MAG: putative 2-aminoethylphosphonate ABC transporter substrate-binding protein [Leptolyngbyaceae cyanobacterium CSU_1_4]|nr:putative 2-aminoethylphosphonate ABC transporter substrate-binding protein [Leptolyngbyaceae cyanobacterium CSU_1_4]